MGSLSQREEVEKLRDIVATNSASAWPIPLIASLYPPDVGVVAFFSKAGADCSTLFLDDSSLVGNRLGRTHVSNKLLDYPR